MPYQGDKKGLPARKPMNYGISHTYFVDVSPDGYGVYEDEVVDEEEVIRLEGVVD